MTEFESFYPYVSPSCEGASEPMMDRAIRDAAIDFASRTQLFRVTLDPISVQSGVSEIDLDAPTDSVIHRVLKAWYGSQPLGVTNVEDLRSPDAVNPNYPGAQADTGTPMGIIYASGSTAVLLPAPDTTAASAVTVHAVIKPARASRRLADEFDRMFEEYAPAIGAGALSSILMTRNQPFYDPKTANEKLAEFNVAVNAALLRAINGDLGSKPLRVRIPRI